MKIKTTCICPPIPDRSHDWACYDSDSYDANFDYEADRYVSSSIVGYGETEDDAIIDFVRSLIERQGIDIQTFQWIAGYR